MRNMPFVVTPPLLSAGEARAQSRRPPGVPNAVSPFPPRYFIATAPRRDPA